MRGLLRKPLLWMMVAECAVVGALIVVVWRELAAPPSRDAAAAQVFPISAAPSDSPSPPSLDVLAPPTKGAPQLPGLNLSTDFWRLRLVDLNRDEAQLEQMQWRVVHSAMDVVHRYLDAVVLPAVARVERGG